MARIPFASAVDEFSDPAERESSLLIVRLHRQSKLFPDIYFDRYSNHFTMMHVSREQYNVGHLQKYVRAMLHNAYEAGGKSKSPKAKLPPAFLDSNVYQFPMDSCVWPYDDWTMGVEGKSTLAEHFVFLSEETMPFCTDPGQPHVPPDFTLGLADVSDWLARAGEAPWILDPKECPKPVRLGPDSTGRGSGGSPRKRKWRKKHHHRRKLELKVTNHGEGRDSPVWSHGGILPVQSLPPVQTAASAPPRRTQRTILPGSLSNKVTPAPVTGPHC